MRLPFERLPELVADGRTAFVTDANLATLPIVASVLAEMPRIEVIEVPVGEPRSSVVGDVARRLVEGRTEGVVAFGGGSVIDTAKLASLVAATPSDVARHLGTVQVVDGALDVLAVPTTSGSGAEVTRTSVVSHEGRKTWAWNDRLRPRRVLVDPVLTHGLPRAGTIATGLDALVHALESATAPDSDATAVACGDASAGTILEALPIVVADGRDPEGRAEMLDAALVAGFAIDRAGTGVGHGVGHALASLLPIPHGLAVAFGMWVCLSWGMSGAPERYARIDPDGRLHDRIGNLLDVIGFGRELDRWIDRPLDPVLFAAELAHPDHRPMCVNNARPVGVDDIPEVAELVAGEWNARFG